MAKKLGMKVVLGADTSQYRRAMKRSQGLVTSFQRQFRKLGGIMAGVFAASKVASFSKEIFNLGSGARGVERAFSSMEKSVIILNKLKKSTKGTVSEIKLMQTAMKARNFQIPMDVLAKGLEFATKRAAETGESIDYMVDSFVLGLSRQSVKIIDNLGISALRVREEMGKTGDFMKAVGKIVDEELTKMGSDFTTNAQKAQSLSAEFENIKTTLGEMMNKGAGGALSSISNILGGINNSIQIKKLKQEREEINALVLSITDFAIGTDERRKALDRLMTLYPEYFGNIDKEKVKNEDLLKQLKLVNDQYAQKIIMKQYEEELGKVAKAEERLQTKRIEHIKSLKLLNDKYNLHAQTLDEMVSKFNDILTKPSWADFRAYMGQGLVAGIQKSINFLNSFEGKLNDISSQKGAIVKAKNALLDLIKTTDTKIVTGGGRRTGGSPKPTEPSRLAMQASPMVINPFEGLPNQVDKSLKDTTSVIQRDYELMKDLTKNFSIDLGSMLQQGIMSAVDEITAGIENLISGNGNIQQFMDSMIRMFGRFIENMGKMIMSYGGAMLAFEQAFENPYAAITAGAALAAIGAVIVGAASRGPTGGGYSTPVTGYGTASAQPAVQVQIEGKIRGEDIYYVTKKQETRFNRLSG